MYGSSSVPRRSASGLKRRRSARTTFPGNSIWGPHPYSGVHLDDSAGWTELALLRPSSAKELPR